MKKATVKKARTYDSTYRTAQTEQTRHLILDTLAEMVAEEGFEGIVVNDIAARAGLAARTIYRHFPDRDALHDALSERIGELNGWSSPELGVHDDWPELIQRVYEGFDEQEVVCTVAARINAVRARTSAESTRRRSAFRDQVRANYPDLAPSDVEAVVAVILLVGSSRTWLRLREELDLPGNRSGPIMRWVLDLVLADIDARGRVPNYVTGRED